MKSIGTIRLGATLALLLALGVSSASAFTFRNHSRTNSRIRFRKTRKYTNMSTKIRHKRIKVHATNRIVRPRYARRTYRRSSSPAVVSALMKKRYQQSSPVQLRFNQRYTPDFRTSTSFLTSTHIASKRTATRTRPQQRKIAIKMKSPSKPLTVKIAGPSTTSSVQALWGKIRVSD